MQWSQVYFMGFQVAQVVKNPPAASRDAGSIPVLWRSPGGGNGNSLQYSCLGNPKDRAAWWATVHGVAKSWTGLSDWTHTQLPVRRTQPSPRKVKALKMQKTTDNTDGQEAPSRDDGWIQTLTTWMSTSQGERSPSARGNEVRGTPPSPTQRVTPETRWSLQSQILSSYCMLDHHADETTPHL